MDEFGVARDQGLNANFRVRAPEASEDSGQHKLAEILLHPEPDQTELDPIRGTTRGWI